MRCSWGSTWYRLRAHRGEQLQFMEANNGDGTYLSGPEDDPVLVLRSVILVVLQLLSFDAYSHWSQLLVHAKVIGMF